MHFHADTRLMAPAELAELIEQAPTAICTVAVPSLRIASANREFARLAGVDSPKALVGYDAAHAPRGSLAARLLPILCWAAERGEATPDAEIRLANGAYRTLCVRCVPLKHADGSVCAVATVLTDVTQSRRLEEELRARAAQQAAVAALGQQALADGDLTALMDQAVVQVASVLDAEFCEVLELLPDGSGLVFRAGAGWHRGWQGRVVARAGTDSQAGYALLAGAPVVVEDLQSETRFTPPPLLLEQGVVSGMSVAIQGQLRPYGVLGVHTARRRVFASDDAYFLQSVGNVLGAAIERRRAEDALQESEARTRRIAAGFQSALLPRPEMEVPGCQVAHTYRPALHEADVGGDFYNLFPIEGGSVGLVIGDVGGKGLDAAVLAARAQHTVTALATGGNLRPGDVLAATRRVVSVSEPDRILTLFFGVLHPRTGRLRCCNAGHEPALVWRAGERRVELFAPDGAAIFGIPAGDYGTRETALEPGDVLFLYTDGLPDARRNTGGAPLGLPALEALLARCHDEHPAAIIEAMYRAADLHSGGSVRDDVAMIVLKRLPTGGDGERALFVEPPPTADPSSWPLDSKR